MINNYQLDLVSPDTCPKSASLRNFIRHSPYSFNTPRALPVSTHLFRTLVILASRCWLAISFLAFIWIISGRSLFLTIARNLSRSPSCSATHFLLYLSLLTIFWLSSLGEVLIVLDSFTHSGILRRNSSKTSKCWYWLCFLNVCLKSTLMFILRNLLPLASLQYTTCWVSFNWNQPSACKEATENRTPSSAYQSPPSPNIHGIKGKIMFWCGTASFKLRVYVL